jgi:hypothetical protein
VSYRGIVYVDSVILAKVPEDRASESCTHVSDDAIGHTKAMLDVSDEFSSSSDVTFVTGRTSIHLVNLSTDTSIRL